MANQPQSASSNPMDWKQFEIKRIQLKRQAGQQKDGPYGFSVDEKTQGTLVVHEAKANGMVTGDILWTINGRRVRDKNELGKEMTTGGGDTIRMTVLRQRAVPLDVGTLRPLPNGEKKPDCVYTICRLYQPNESGAGLTTIEIEGVISVKATAPNSPSIDAGLRVKDRILAVDTEPITGTEQLKRLVGMAKGDVIDLLIERPSSKKKKVKSSPRAKDQKPKTPTPATVAPAAASDQQNLATSLGLLKDARSFALLSEKPSAISPPRAKPTPKKEAKRKSPAAAVASPQPKSKPTPSETASPSTGSAVQAPPPAPSQPKPKSKTKSKSKRKKFQLPFIPPDPSDPDGNPVEDIPDVPLPVQALMDACREKVAKRFKNALMTNDETSSTGSGKHAGPDVHVSVMPTISSTPLKKEETPK